MKLTKLLPKSILVERYITLIKPEDRTQYVDLVWDMLQQTYKKLGGFKSARDKEDLIADSSIWKMVRKNGKIVAVSIYKDKLDDLMKTNVKNGFHVHTPDGATPKDGPSAGCAFTCAFISRILHKPIKNDIAMTGEIELTGKISKIGGLEFKLQGAKRAGVKTVYIPMENKKDLDEIKEKYKNLINENNDNNNNNGEGDSFNIKLVNTIDDIINEILI
jgi:predicted ATP-dependent protease